MHHTVKGKILAFEPVRNGVDRNDQEFVMQRIPIEVVDGSHKKTYLFTAWNDVQRYIENRFEIGDEIEVWFNIESHTVNGIWRTYLKPFKVFSVRPSNS